MRRMFFFYAFLAQLELIPKADSAGHEDFY
jgi:hypothetical protein